MKEKQKTTSTIHKRKNSYELTKKKINWLLAILLITFIIYFPTLQNEFTTWDDDKYVTENYQIRDFTFNNIEIFFSDYYYGIYHPFTMASLMIDYHFNELDATYFHLVSLILHLINTALVFILILAIINNLEIAIITSLLFGVHTLHVESVAWVSGRKDVLYALFYLLSLITYIKYLNIIEIRLMKAEIKKNSFQIQFSKATAYYFFSLILYLFSILSKGMAVTLAFSVIAIDYLFKRNLLSRMVIFEKIPFIVLSVIFGIISIHAPETTGGMTNPVDYTLFEEIHLASYAFVQYLLKMIIPINLSAYYPYPENISGLLYLFPVLFIAYILIIVFINKKSRLSALKSSANDASGTTFDSSTSNSSTINFFSCSKVSLSAISSFPF